MSFNPELHSSPSIVRPIYSKNQLLAYIEEGQGRAIGLFCFVESTDSDNSDDGRIGGSYMHKLDLEEGKALIIFEPTHQENMNAFEIDISHIIGGHVKVISNVEFE